MFEIDTARLRLDLKRLDRTELFALSRKLGISRDAIDEIALTRTDPEEVLTAEAHAALTGWYIDFVLRRALAREDVMLNLADVEKHIEGMTVARVTAFREERVELTADEKSDLFVLVRGGYGMTSTGKFVSPRVAPPPLPFGTTSSSVSADMLRRRKALDTLAALPTEDLEALASCVETGEVAA